MTVADDLRTTPMVFPPRLHHSATKAENLSARTGSIPWVEASVIGTGECTRARRRRSGDGNAMSSPIGAEAIPDVGRAIRNPIGHHRVTEAPISVVRRTSYAEPVEAGISRPQARPLPYR